MREVTKYEAFDGAVFDTAAECDKYEKAHRPPYWALIGLNADKIAEAWANPATSDLAAEIISLGYSLASARKRAAGKKLQPLPGGELEKIIREGAVSP